MKKYKTTPDYETWKRWKQLINMSVSELKRFMNSPEGKVAGLSIKKAKSLKIKSGQESARWLLKMIPLGNTFERAKRYWTPTMWGWARRQVSFNSRMRGVPGPLYRDGKMTRKLTSLLIWAHDPRKPLGKIK